MAGGEPEFSRGLTGWCQVRVRPDGQVLGSRVRLCRTFASRLLGLMFRPRLKPGEGALLILAGETRWDATIHMLFVFFPIAVFWLDHQGTVVSRKVARPWRPFYAPLRAAQYVLELEQEVLPRANEGERLELDAIAGMG
ncbi:MAG: DUF192 domain-containing protein [Anaerolineales bacterium]